MPAFSVLFLLTTFSFLLVISRPEDVTTCEGRRAVFTCVLNTNFGSIQWYRVIKSTGAIESVDQRGENINFISHTTENTTNSTLTITNARASYNGYFWIGTRSSGVCNVSLTVGTSMLNNLKHKYAYTKYTIN